MLAVTAEPWLVKAVAEGVEHVPLDGVPDGNGNRFAGVFHFGTTDQTIGRCHRYGTDDVVTEVLGNLEGNCLGDGL